MTSLPSVLLFQALDLSQAWLQFNCLTYSQTTFQAVVFVAKWGNKCFVTLLAHIAGRYGSLLV